MQPSLVEWYPVHSRLGSVALVAVGLAVLCSLPLVTPVDPWQWLVVALLSGLFTGAIVQQWRRKPQQFGLEKGQWYLRQQGQRVPVKLRYSHFISYRMGVIEFMTANGKKVAITILPDSLSVEDCRKLAVALA